VPVRELAVLVRADLAGVRNHFVRSAWGDRLGSLAALAVAGGFAWGCHLFFVRVFRGIRGLEALEALLPSALLVLTGQLLAMTALTAFASLLASAMVTSLSTALQARDLPAVLALPVRPSALFGHRLLRAALAAGGPVMLILLPAAAALGTVWGHRGAVLLMAAATGPLLVLGTTALALATLLGLVRVFPAGRVAQLAASSSALAIALIVGALRAARPERLFNPASGADLLDALRSLQLPSLEAYPSTWMAASWLAVATGGSWACAVAELVAGTALACALAAWAFVRWHRTAWVRVTEAPPPILPGLRTVGRLGGWLADRFAAPTAAVARLELASLTRDPGQFTQLALLVGLVALYLYNLKLIPGDQHVLGPLLALLNVGVAGLVLAAVAVRLGLPSVSRDGPSRWLSEAAPLPARQRLLAKTMVVGAALTLLGGGLSAAAAALLAGPAALKLQAVATVVVMAPTLAAVAVGVGARFPRYDIADPVQIAISSGGLLCFAAMLAYVGLMTTLAARPVLAWYLRMIGAGRAAAVLAPWMATTAQVGLSAALATGALAWGARRLER
jgi:hypothetical protein